MVSAINTLVSIRKRQPKNTNNKLCNMNCLKTFMLAAHSSNCLRTEECLHTVYKCIYAHIYRYNWKATKTRLPWENDKGNFYVLQYIKTMHALASTQHVQDKITSTSRITLTLHQRKHLPCCTHAGSLCPISHSWLMEHIWMVNLGRTRSPWFPWSDRRNQISNSK